MVGAALLLADHRPPCNTLTVIDVPSCAPRRPRLVPTTPAPGRPTSSSRQRALRARLPATPTLNLTVLLSRSLPTCLPWAARKRPGPFAPYQPLFSGKHLTRCTFGSLAAGEARQNASLYPRPHRTPHHIRGPLEQGTACLQLAGLCKPHIHPQSVSRLGRRQRLPPAAPARSRSALPDLRSHGLPCVRNHGRCSCTPLATRRAPLHPIPLAGLISAAHASRSTTCSRSTSPGHRRPAFAPAMGVERKPGLSAPETVKHRCGVAPMTRAAAGLHPLCLTGAPHPHRGGG